MKTGWPEEAKCTMSDPQATEGNKLCGQALGDEKSAFALNKRARAPRVEVLNPTGTDVLVLRVHLRPGEAKAVAGWSNATDRRKADASRAVRDAADTLRGMAKVAAAPPQERDRGGLLQGDVPRDLLEHLRKLAARARPKADATDLFRASVHLWVDPKTGRRRPGRARPDGAKPRPAGPRNLDRHLAPSRQRYLEVKGVKGATVRFQVRFSKKAADMIKGELADYGLKHGLFLTAIMERICLECDPEGELAPRRPAAAPPKDAR